MTQVPGPACSITLRLFQQKRLMLDWSFESLTILPGDVVGTPSLWTIWRMVIQILKCSVTDFFRLTRPAFHLVGTDRLRADYEAIVRDRQCLSVYLTTSTILTFHIGCHDRTSALSFCSPPADMSSSYGGGFGKDGNPLPFAAPLVSPC